MRMIEYATTHGRAARFLGEQQQEVHTQPDDPCPPEGNGWEMVGASATPDRLYWFWKRESPGT
jgi:hypothetical protein